MQANRTQTNPGRYHYWIMVVAVSLPLAWGFNRVVGEPLGGYVFGLVLFGMQWMLVRVLRLQVPWTVMLVANCGPIVGFDLFLLVELSEWLRVTALMLLLPLGMVLLMVASLAIVWIPLGLYRLAKVIEIRTTDQKQGGWDWRTWLKKYLRQFFKLYLIYFVGSFFGVGYALLAGRFARDALLSDHAYGVNIWLRVGMGAITGLYTWLVLRRHQIAGPSPTESGLVE